MTTHQQISISCLGPTVYWVGDNLGLDDEEQIVLADSDGNRCYVSPEQLLSHPVWSRLDRYSRMRIEGGLEVSRNVRMRRQSCKQSAT